jgi:hypothetical protein
VLSKSILTAQHSWIEVAHTHVRSNCREGGGHRGSAPKNCHCFIKDAHFVISAAQIEPYLPQRVIDLEAWPHKARLRTQGITSKAQSRYATVSYRWYVAAQSLMTSITFRTLSRSDSSTINHIMSHTIILQGRRHTVQDNKTKHREICGKHSSCKLTAKFCRCCRDLPPAWYKVFVD